MDGSPEVIVAASVFAAHGALRWTAPAGGYGRPAVVDLDGDGFMEIVTGPEAYRHDGTLYFSSSDVSATMGETPAVADLDGDGLPKSS